MYAAIYTHCENIRYRRSLQTSLIQVKINIIGGEKRLRHFIDMPEESQIGSNDAECKFIKSSQSSFF